jgi:hypothetical protein
VFESFIADVDVEGKLVELALFDMSGQDSNERL